MITMTFFSTTLAVLLVLLARSALALEVTPGSKCADYCLDMGNVNGHDPNASHTRTSDVVCNDSEYGSTNAGAKFESCVQCLENSKAVSESESDLHWYLYNLRYTVTTCLFSVPQAPAKSKSDHTCNTEDACGPLKASLTADKLSASSNETYGYCTEGGSLAREDVASCVKCLRSKNDQSYTSNFLVALEAGCEQKPDAGERLLLSSTVFTTKEVRINDEDDQDSGPSKMKTGTIVGIAVGTSLLFIGGIVLFCIYWRRQKKADPGEKDSDYFNGPSTTPDPLFGSNEMTMSARTQSQQSYYDARCMTAGDYYDKMEEMGGTATTAPRPNYSYGPYAQQQRFSQAQAPRQSYVPSALGGLSSHPSMIGPPPPTYNPARYSTFDATPSQPRNSVPPPPRQSKIPSLFLPSGPKLRMPRKYTPPTMAPQEAESAGQPQEMQISGPMMHDQSRFQDAPLAGGVVYTDAVPNSQNANDRDYYEVPLRSGKSDLFG